MMNTETEDWDVVDPLQDIDKDYEITRSPTFSESVASELSPISVDLLTSEHTNHPPTLTLSVGEYEPRTIVIPEPLMNSGIVHSNINPGIIQSNVIPCHVNSESIQCISIIAPSNNNAVQIAPSNITHKRENNLKTKLASALHGYEFVPNLQNSKKAKMKLIETAMKFSIQGQFDISSLLHILKDMLYDLRLSNLHEDTKKSIVITMLDIISDTIPDPSVNRKFRNWLSVDCVPIMNFLYELTPHLFKYNTSPFSEWLSMRK
jgi:hypothetical protein